MIDDPHALLKRAIQCREIGDFKKAQEYLDKMIDADPENHLLWYEKSKLPIVQEDSTTIRSRTVSLSTYLQLSLPDKRNYLQQCGFGITEIPDVENSLRAPNLIENQRTRYIKMAINYAPENERVIYVSELNSIAETAAKSSRKDTRAAIITGSVALIISFVAVFMLNKYYHTALFQIPMNAAIALLIPYALSVTGMALYSKAKNNGSETTIGLVFNLIALIVSNLSIVNALFLYFSK